MAIILAVLFGALAFAGQGKYLVLSIEFPKSSKPLVEYATRAEGEALPLISSDEKTQADQYSVTVEDKSGKSLSTDTFGFRAEYSDAPDGKFIDGGKVFDPNRSRHFYFLSTDFAASKLKVAKGGKEILALDLASEFERLLGVSMAKGNYLASETLEKLFKQPPPEYRNNLEFLQKIKGALDTCSSFPKKHHGRCQTALLMVDSLIGRVGPAQKP